MVFFGGGSPNIHTTLISNTFNDYLYCSFIKKKNYRLNYRKLSLNVVFLVGEGSPNIHTTLIRNGLFAKLYVALSSIFYRGRSFMVTMVAMVTRHVRHKVCPEAEETAEHSASITTDDN
jgi:hypothetical protein